MKNKYASLKPSITLFFIGKEPNDLRWFILLNERHAGGITIHSTNGSTFSYGIAIAPLLRRKGIASVALYMLFDLMKKKGYTLARTHIQLDNVASLRLHQALGFTEIKQTNNIVTMERIL